MAGMKYVLGKQAAKAAHGTFARTGSGLFLNRTGNLISGAMENELPKTIWGQLLRHEYENEEK